MSSNPIHKDGVTIDLSFDPEERIGKTKYENMYMLVNANKNLEGKTPKAVTTSQHFMSIFSSFVLKV